MQLKLPLEVVIKYNLTIQGLGYNFFYYCSMNIVAQSCCILILGMSFMVFTQWYEPHCQLTYLSYDLKTDHQLTNELV
jgi:hypothetical protein